MKRQKSKLPASFRVQETASASGLAKAGLALGVSTAIFLPLGAQAAEEVEMATVRVVEKAIDPNPHAEVGVPYKAKKSGDERHIKPLAETPQTISVLTQQQLQDTGRSDLREILRAQPGITLGTGENGNAFGDRYIIRGQEARSDVFVDGLRDPGMTVRESFAVDQIEITKGPSATFAGRGATGGAINAVTKQATTDTDFTKLSAGIGTDHMHRVTIDSNYVLTDTAAVRVNLLDAYQEVPDRGPADRTRKGAALSFNIKPTDKLDVTADYYHLEARDKPDLGTYLVNGIPKKDIPAYAQTGDFLSSMIDTYTLRLAYQASEKVRLTNLTRYGTTRNGYVATSMRGNGTSVSLSTHNGWQEVEYFANQTNLYIDETLAGMRHQFILGAEYSDHSVLNGSYASSGTTSATVWTAAGGWVNNLNSTLNRGFAKGGMKSDWQNKTISLYAMDTVDVTDKWAVFGGVRYDRFNYSNQLNTGLNYKLDDGLWNAHLGVTYKFKPDANVYATYSTASDFNGGESDVTSCDYGGICVPSALNGVTLTNAQREALFKQSKPEKSTNLEVGSKWEFFGGKLLATAAAFQVTKSDVMELLTGASYTDIGSMNSGKYKVEGVEFSIAGNLTDKLSAHGGISLMNAKWLASQDPSKLGKGLTNFPEKSASLLLNYQATPKFNFGGNVTYQSVRYSGTPESPESLAVSVPAYTIYDMFAAYRFTKALKVQLNVGNVSNEKYYLTAYRSGGMLYMGDARNARLTVNYDF